MADNYLISVYSANSSTIGKDENVELLWKEDLSSYVSEFGSETTVEDFLNEIKKECMGNPKLHADVVMELCFGADSCDEGNFFISSTSVYYTIGTIEKIEPDGSTTLIYKFRNIPSDLIVEAQSNKEATTWEDLFLDHNTNYTFELANSALVLSAQDTTLRSLLNVGNGTFQAFDWISPDEDDDLEEYLIQFLRWKLK